MKTDLDRLANEKYVSLTTVRRSGEGVATPVWVARDGEFLVVITDATSGKAERLRNNAAVTVAPCDMRGNVRGSAVAGQAALLDEAETQQVEQVIRKKYGVVTRLFEFKELAAQAFSRVLRRPDPASRVGIRIELALE